MVKNDLTGQRFGKLIAIKPVGTNKSGNTLWECKCDCGNSSIVINSNLTRENSKSCGCTNSERLIKRNTSHGMSKTKIYAKWLSMLERCRTKTNTDYKYYGARGINVCKEWKDFNKFYKWAMNNGYENSLTIDRINVNGNYEPSNCRWVTQLRQCNNKRNNLYLTIDGVTASLADICRMYNARYTMVWKRLRRGWSIEKAVLN